MSMRVCQYDRRAGRTTQFCLITFDSIGYPEQCSRMIETCPPCDIHDAPPPPKSSFAHEVLITARISILVIRLCEHWNRSNSSEPKSCGLL